MCRAFSPEVQERTWNSLLKSEDENIVLGAAKYLTDRLYGKAVEKRELTGTDGAPMQAEIVVRLVKTGE